MNSNAKKWIEALRSGRFNQTTEYLSRCDQDGDTVSHCCLGVACELAIEDGVDLRRKASEVDIGYESPESRYAQHYCLPESVKKWLGLAGTEGSFDEAHEIDDWGYNSLTELNDHGLTFAEIADFIESEPEGLFQ